MKTKITIARALKEKNRILGRMEELRLQIQESNYVVENGFLGDLEALAEGYVPKIETSTVELFKKYMEEHASLVDIKKRIAKGNIGIQDKLIELSEVKSELSRWKSMKPLCRNSETKIFLTSDGMRQYTVQHYQIDRKELQQLLDTLQKSVETLQDEVDTYNASTLV